MVDIFGNDTMKIIDVGVGIYSKPIFTQRRKDAEKRWTILRLTGMKLGLLVNFNVNLIKDGIERVVNGL